MFQTRSEGSPYSLSDLTQAVFGIRIQEGAHNALEDGKAPLGILLNKGSKPLSTS